MHASTSAQDRTRRQHRCTRRAAHAAHARSLSYGLAALRWDAVRSSPWFIVLRLTTQATLGAALAGCCCCARAPRRLLLHRLLAAELVC